MNHRLYVDSYCDSFKSSLEQVHQLLSSNFQTVQEKGEGSDDAMRTVVIESSESSESALESLVKRCGEARKMHGASAFIAMYHPLAIENAAFRWSCVTNGCNMMTCNLDHLSEALQLILSQRGDPNESYECPICGAGHLSAVDLWTHMPLYHINNSNIRGSCPICNDEQDNLAVHLHTTHGPSGPLIEHFPGIGSAVVVHRRSDDKFLMVQEFAGQGFWVPGGSLDPGESLRSCAIRECEEEAGVKVALHGVLEVMMDLSIFPHGWRLVVFYATLVDTGVAIDQPDSMESVEMNRARASKTVPCYESGGTCWVSAQDIKDGTFKLRSSYIPTKWFEKLSSNSGNGPIPLLEIPRLELGPDVAPFFEDVEF